MADANQGAQAKMAGKDGTGQLTWSSGATYIDFISESVRKVERHIMPKGIRGTRSRPKERTRQGPYFVLGTIRLNPDPAALDFWLPYILGTAESADSFALAETMLPFGLLIDKKFDVYDYQDLYVNRALFQGRSYRYMEEDPEPIELILEVVGKVEATNESAFPSLTPGVASNNAPYIFNEGVLTLQSSSRNAMSFRLLINNFLDTRFAIGSRTASSITPRDREITLQCITPATSDESGLYGETFPGTSGTLVFTNGNMSTTFTFANLNAPDKTPVVRGKTEILMELDRFVTQSTTTKELVVTSDSTA